MKLYRLAALQLVLLGCLPAPSLLAQRREDILSIQRDVAQLQDQIKQLQSSQDQKLAALESLIKQALNASPANTLEQQLALEAKLQREAGRTADFKEGVKAFLEKRGPRYVGR
jgi:2-(1,2-epoxy-1,2-dihydrophenyl)acetyl-CoA isomerase